MILTVLLRRLVKRVINSPSYPVSRPHCLGRVSIVPLLERRTILTVRLTAYYRGGMHLAPLCVRHPPKILVTESVPLYLIRKCVKRLCAIVLFRVSCRVFLSVLGTRVPLSSLVTSRVCRPCCLARRVRNLYTSGRATLTPSLITRTLRPL